MERKRQIGVHTVPITVAAPAASTPTGPLARREVMGSRSMAQGPPLQDDRRLRLPRVATIARVSSIVALAGTLALLALACGARRSGEAQRASASHEFGTSGAVVTDPDGKIVAI